jgi:hypothetical protein
MTDSPEPKYINEHLAGVKNRLKRLQERTGRDLRSMMPDRAAQFFSLQHETVPQQAVYRVQVMIYPQDPFVGEAEIRHMNAEDIRPGLVNDRVVIRDSQASSAQPDEQGNYLYPPGTPEFDQVNAFYYTTMTLRMYERYTQRPLPWAFSDEVLDVDPHAGNDANAFYNEHEQWLGFQLFVPTPGAASISTAQSADIVSHEAGHAVLDGLRDYYNESFGLGTAAFHESFGDMTAVLVALHDDSLLRQLLTRTKDNLQLDNFIAEIGEQLSGSLSARTPDDFDHTIYLRNAINKLIALPFNDLVYRPLDPVEQLGRQPHNYSRLFTGAFYDALIAIYEHQRKTAATPHIALTRARDILGKLLITAVECGPVGELQFADMAKAFLAADQLLHQGTYAALLIDVFQKRGIATADELNAFRAALSSIPHITLPELPNGNDAAVLAYLEAEIIPALKLPTDVTFAPTSTYRNADGFAFLTFVTKTKLALSGEQFANYSGAELEVYGGLSLAFSPQYKLVSAMYRPVTDEDLHQIQAMIVDLIHEGSIVAANGTSETETPTTSEIPSQEEITEAVIEIPQGVVLADDSTPHPHDTRLIKFPAIVDNLRPASGFREYLQRLRGKSNDRET